MKTFFEGLVVATVLATLACNGRVEQVLGADEGVADKQLPPPGGQVTPTPALPPAGGNDCSVDADCNELATTSALLGRCWKRTTGPNKTDPTGSCLCLKGNTLQPSGKCARGAPSPSLSCAQEGGACRDWGECTSAGGRRAGLASSRVGTSKECGNEAGTEECCVPKALCRETPIAKADCYFDGTDLAYVPVCISGWVTCLPGDSPDINP
jgi:hypothetical protein